jgi:transposase InsO family protein
MQRICQWYGISAQAHYQARRRHRVREEDAEVVLSLVRKKRSRHPRMGTRKLLAELRPSMARQGIKMGRDRLFSLLRAQELLVKRRRRSHRTTYAGWWRCEDLLSGTEIERVNQAWVSDITYLECEEGFRYLSLITDVYSRYIVGYHVSASLAVEGTLSALKMACRGKKRRGTIHHSDRGTQYTCSAYRQFLQARGMKSSMGAAGNCYDNAIAERINGILKEEYGLGYRFSNHNEVKAAVHEAIWLYNHERPHLSLDYKKPAQVYLNYIE